MKLESLEDAVVLEDFDDDLLSDKHGCPAYVSPEILRSNTQYSGRSADMWGLGVMLYTMLVGRLVEIRELIWIKPNFTIADILSTEQSTVDCLLRSEEDNSRSQRILVPELNVWSSVCWGRIQARESQLKMSSSTPGSSGLIVNEEFIVALQVQRITIILSLCGTQALHTSPSTVAHHTVRLQDLQVITTIQDNDDLQLYSHSYSFTWL